MDPKQNETKINQPATATATAAPADDAANRSRGGENRPKQTHGLAKAPEGAFSKKAQPKGEEDTTQADLVRSLIEEYANGAGRSVGDLGAAKRATRSLFTAVRMISSLTGVTLNRSLGFLVKAISNDTTAAFDKMLLCRFVGDIASTNERNNFVRIITLMTTYARLSDKTAIRDMVDVEYSLELIKSVETKSQFNAFIK